MLVSFFTSSNASDESKMKTVRILCGLFCFLVLASNVWSMSRWSEARGVYDDICYLRQAHLFQRFGLKGFDTDISRDDDRYLASKLKEIGFPSWSDVSTAPCHTPMPAANKLVIQYPPGTGLVLALFPPGFQVVPLYVVATTIVFGFALLGILYARSTSSIFLVGGFGCLAIYLMINPAKASYSIAPTMVVCALAGFLTAKLFFSSRRHKILLTMLLGLCIGLSVNFRLPNLFLSAGYLLFLLASFARMRNKEALLQGALVALAIGWTGWTLRSQSESGIRQVALVTAVNLLVNLAFFASHPIFTPYYTIPIAMLSLWSLLFASLMRPAEVVDDAPLERAARA